MLSFSLKLLPKILEVPMIINFRYRLGKQIELSNYKNKVIVDVDVASRCGYTPQYEDLQLLWSEYEDRILW